MSNYFKNNKWTKVVLGICIVALFVCGFQKEVITTMAMQIEKKEIISIPEEKPEIPVPEEKKGTMSIQEEEPIIPILEEKKEIMPIQEEAKIPVPEEKKETISRTEGNTISTQKKKEKGTSKLDYILGRPMTKQEIEKQKAAEPKNFPDTFIEEESVPSVRNFVKGAEPFAFPISYDARNWGVVTPVKNQGKWGTCWAHAVVACAESSLLSKKLISMEEADLSERHLAYFHYHTPEDPLGNAVGDQLLIRGEKNYLERGGSDKMAAFSLANWVGFAHENVAPYNAKEMPEDLEENVAYQNIAHLKNVYWVAPSDIDQIKSLIMKMGAAKVGAYGGSENLQKYYNYHTGAYFSDVSKTNHEVTVIGWDDTYSVENFNSNCRPTSDGAWLAKNSWGENWGDEGYFWISYEDAPLNSTSFAFFDVGNTEEYQHNYHYDGVSGTSSWGFSNGCKIANIYTATKGTKGAQTIQAVSFALKTPNVRYSIQVYKNVKDESNPESGIPVWKQSQAGRTSYSGYYTIPLQEAVTIKDGKKFSIVIQLEQDSKESIYCHVDVSGKYATSDGEIWCELQASQFEGQSFYKMSSFVNWQDAATYKTPFTLRIKGFTSDTEPVLVSSISLQKNSIEMKQTEKQQLKVSFVPSNVTDPSIIWSSSNEKVAKVDENGIVTAMSVGDCTITAKSVEGAKTSCKITVWKPQKTKGMKVVKKTTSLVQFQWTKQPKVSGYLVYRYNSKKNVWETLKYLESKDKNTYTDKKLKSGTTYFYAVRAYARMEKGILWGDSSEFLRVKTNDKLKVPTLSSISNTTSGIQIKWKKVTRASGYYLYRKADSGTWKKIATIKKGSVTNYTDKTVKSKNGTLYSYTVAAFNSDDNSGYHKTGKKIVRLLAPKISNLTNKASKSITVKWKQNKKANSYQIQYATSNKFKKAVTINIKSGKTTTKTIKNLKKNKTYYIRIRSCKKSGKTTYRSTWSSSKKVKIKK